MLQIFSQKPWNHVCWRWHRNKMLCWTTFWNLLCKDPWNKKGTCYFIALLRYAHSVSLVRIYYHQFVFELFFTFVSSLILNRCCKEWHCNHQHIIWLIQIFTVHLLDKRIWWRLKFFKKCSENNEEILRGKKYTTHLFRISRS